MNLSKTPIPALHAAGAATILAIASLWYATAIHPLEQARAERQSREAALVEQQRRLSELSSQRQVLSAEIQRLRKQLSDRVDLLPRSRMNERLARLTELATECGLTIDELSPKDWIARGALAEVPINATLRGDFADIARFMNALHDRTPDVDVRSFDIGGTPSRGSEDIRAALVLAWYADPAA